MRWMIESVRKKVSELFARGGVRGGKSPDGRAKLILRKDRDKYEAFEDDGKKKLTGSSRSSDCLSSR